MDDKQLKMACVKARAKVLSNFPQLSPIILGLPYQIIPNFNSAFVTANGVVGMGADYIKKYSNPELAACFMHEGLHIMFDHLGRAQLGHRDPRVWNEAGDIVINETLRRMTATCSGDVSPDKDMLYPEHYGFEWALNKGPIPTVDTVYDAILSGKNKPKDGKGKGPGAGKGQCGSGAGGAPHELEGTITVEGHDKAMSEENKAKIELAAQSMGSMMKSIGIASAEFEMWANACIKKPKFDPMRELRMAVGMALASSRGRHVEPTYNKANRRGFAYLPGRVHFTPEVTVIVDTSGSMFDGLDGDNVLTEIAGILMKLGKVRIITVDTAVTFDGYIATVADFKKKAKGGGGTELTPAFEAAKDAKAIVVLTDGCLNRPNSPLVENVVWLLTSHYQKSPWMKKAISLAKIPG